NVHTIIRLPQSVFAPYATVNTNLIFFEKGKQTKEIWYYEHILPEGQKAYNKTRPIRIEEFDSIKTWWNNRQESEVCWKVSIDTIIERGYDLDIKNPNKVVEEVELNIHKILSILKSENNKVSSIIQELENDLVK
ncbi:MAG: N-6 DNA methylase, partial [Saprospiraceae bacterium]